ncbi:aromatic amino acid lyase [Lentzea sp. CC55]|uniref:aromatic amino acid lyase n=1 Tax=Lentzea sp. CC55 TaxID=2884909 RepID=UPI0023D95C05|nr:aromatic amino acid lyase [Lentzea sp. CC55]
MLTRLCSLVCGHSGVSTRVIDALAGALRTSFAFAVPELGSVDASGDLVPPAHVVKALRGFGFAYHTGARLAADVALTRAEPGPLALGGRGAVALVNGTSVTSAVAVLTLAKLRRGVVTAIHLTGVLTDLLGRTQDVLSAPLLKAFGYPRH